MHNHDFRPGDRVLARWRGGNFLFPGTVERADDQGIAIAYDDGDRDTRPPADVRPFDWQPGTRIEAIWSGNGQYYAATILRISDSSLAVRFDDDGIEEDTVTARCRMAWTGPSAAVSSAPLGVGQRVLGRWRGGPHWFPAVVRDVRNGTVALAYDDGDSEELPASEVRPLSWTIGSRIEAVWSGDGRYYAAAITDIAPDGSRLSVLFDDGIREDTISARCREA